MEGYTKVKQIGKGNMGVCMLAKAPDGKLVVLKQVSMAKMGSKEKSQAVSEARLLKATNHPNIVRYINSWTTKSDNLMIAMEFVEKGDLCSRVEKARGKGLWKETQVLDWFIQIALAIHYTGKKHILHRDLKTQNILISDDNVLKLADFGISRSLVNTWDKAHTFVGTPYYLAPEIVMQQPYDIQVDAWALGVVLCEMLTLSHPFTGYDMKSLTNNILRGNYTKPSASYSSEMRALVTGLLQKDPKKRMTVAAALRSSIVQRRLKEWLTAGDSLPPADYIRHLVDARCLDGIAPESLLNTYVEAVQKVEGDAEDKDAVHDDKIVQRQHNRRRTDAVLHRMELDAKGEREKIKNEFGSIDGRDLKLGGPPQQPSSAPPSAAASRFPPIGAFPGHCPPAHPRELLAEKRRILALLEQQQQQQQQQHQQHRHLYRQQQPQRRPSPSARGRFY